MYTYTPNSNSRCVMSDMCVCVCVRAGVKQCMVRQESSIRSMYRSGENKESKMPIFFN